jgi:prepilin-type N-terminal cleavage/methylation domain-containing protein
LSAVPTRHPSPHAAEAGFSLLEVIVAVAILATGLVAVAQMFAVSTDTNRSARWASIGTALAQQKIEQIRGLAWGFDAAGLPKNDFVSDLTVAPPAAAGGAGLSASPQSALTANTPGCVDYLDASGAWVGTGATPVSGTVFVRRWSIEPLPINPNNTLIIQVVVQRLRNGQATTQQSVGRVPDEVRLVTLKTRKAT